MEREKGRKEERKKEWATCTKPSFGTGLVHTYVLNKKVMLINSREVILSVPTFSFFLVHNTLNQR